MNLIIKLPQFWTVNSGTPTRQDELSFAENVYDAQIKSKLNSDPTVGNYMVKMNLIFASEPYTHSWPDLYRNSGLYEQGPFPNAYGNTIHEDTNHGIFHIAFKLPHTYSGENDLVAYEYVIRGVSLRLNDPNLLDEGKYNPGLDLKQLKNQIDGMYSYLNNGAGKVFTDINTFKKYNFKTPYATGFDGEIDLKNSPELLKMILSARVLDNKIEEKYTKRLGKMTGSEMYKLKLEDVQLEKEDTAFIKDFVRNYTKPNKKLESPETSITLASNIPAYKDAEKYIQILESSLGR